jgi:hypothetical protein
MKMRIWKWMKGERIRKGETKVLQLCTKYQSEKPSFGKNRSLIVDFGSERNI